MKSPFWIVATEIGHLPTRRFSTQELAESAAMKFAASDPGSTYYILKAVSQCRQIGLEIEALDE